MEENLLLTSLLNLLMFGLHSDFSELVSARY